VCDVYSRYLVCVVLAQEVCVTLAQEVCVALAQEWPGCRSAVTTLVLHQVLVRFSSVAWVAGAGLLIIQVVDF
jgi:hypothetical protein